METPKRLVGRRVFLTVGASGIGKAVSESAEQASVVALLLSEDAFFMTGTSVLVDGGYTAI